MPPYPANYLAEIDYKAALKRTKTLSVLKAWHPTLPVFFSLQVDDFNEDAPLSRPRL
jgi:hypothetical protein